ncbi:MAG: response regulator transcription factor [SAR202 cluster bacterium]|jgi:two-component system KDP operon response regulator KdpE|nr:response regulator transcription factor [SAR202 cluster bacterium]|tara:strand:+ start:3956 stop:4651 length:696 start_codon:yes stop_codon:yes gene_type:complete
MNKKDVLVVDDDRKIVAFVSSQLKHNGYTTEIAYDGAEAVEKAALIQPGLIILDLSMPIVSGNWALRRLREWYEGPIMILSATNEESEKVAALDAGADDYLTKPFGIQELLARVRTLFRRSSLTDTGLTNESRIEIGHITVDLSAKLVYRDGDEVRLTRTEYELLKTLSVNKNKVLSHSEILKEVWGPEYGGETEYLRTFIKQLRRKLEKDPSRPKQILTQPGIGYRLVGQ